MRRYGIVLAMWLCGTGVCLAQQGPQGELQGFYQRIQTFKMRSGGDVFADYDKATNGGGFGFVYGFMVTTNSEQISIIIYNLLTFA